MNRSRNKRVRLASLGYNRLVSARLSQSLSRFHLQSKFNLVRMHPARMGIEYKIRMTESDFAAFENSVTGDTLDSVLRAAPGYLETDGKIYTYSTTGDPMNKWNETVQIEDDGIWLTLYADEPLRRYLMDAVLNTCGRLSIEDG